MRAKGMHHEKFTKSLWRKWLKRLNAASNMHLREGIHEFRSLLARHDMRKERE